MTRWAKVATFLGVSLALVAIAEETARYQHSGEDDKDLQMKVLIKSVDRSSRTFLAASEYGDMQDYHTEGDMPIAEDEIATITYRHRYQWYRFFWQDDNDIDIVGVADGRRQ